MRILYVGQFETPQYDSSMAEAFASHGNDVCCLKVFNYVSGTGILRKIERHILYGPHYSKLYNDMICLARKFRPHMVYFRRPLEFSTGVLEKLKRLTGALLFEYMNDDPFGPDKDRHWLRHFSKTIPLFDIHFAFREINVPEFYEAGARRVEVLWPYYVEDMHNHPILDSLERETYSCDAIFLGHGENDFRCDCFDALIRTGLTLHLGGSGFEAHAKHRPHEMLLPTKYYSADIYSKAIKGANCCLCFFSRRNRDLLTTRVFEIPACGGVLVAERNPLVASLFKENREAFFFSSTEELVNIVRLLKNNPGLRDEVSHRGRQRVLRGSQEVKDRACQILSVAQGML